MARQTLTLKDIGVSKATRRDLQFWGTCMFALRTIMSLSLILFSTFVHRPAIAQSNSGAEPIRFKAAMENSSLEWFFLVADTGRAQGIWAKNGLDPEFVPAALNASQLKERVAAGVRIGAVNTAEVILARTMGTNVKIIGSYFGATTARIYGKANGVITTGAQLDGKKIGIIAASHTSARTVLYMNKKLGIRSEATPLGDLTNNLDALRDGRIDAFYSSEGATLALVDSGELRVILPVAEVYPKPYAAFSMWATEDLIAEYPDLVRRFVAAASEAAAFIKSNPNSAVELYVKRTNATPLVASKAVASLTNVLTTNARGSGDDLIAAVHGNWTFIVDSGAVTLTNPASVADAVETRFLP